MKGIDGYDPIPVYSSLCYCFSLASGTLRGGGGYLPVAYFPLRQGQRARQTPDAGSLGRTSEAVMVCPFTFLP